MSGFQVPYSSSPPSTPDRRSRNGNKFSFGQSNPSTTPAGPPPSSAGSFTPAGPPPSSYYGSSTNESPAPMKSLSFSQQSFGSSPLQFNSPKTQQATSFMRPAAKVQRSNLSNEYQSSPQRDFQGSTYGIDEEDEEEYSDEDERREEEYEDQDADAMTDDEPRYDDEMEDSQTGTPGRTTGSIQLGLNSPSQESSVSELRQSREEPMDLGGTLGNSFSEPKSFMYTRVAKDLYGQMGSPMVAESDDVVVSTEAIITKLYEEGVAADNDDALEHALMQIPLELTKVWSMYDKNTAVPSSEEYSARIGPGLRSSAFSKANFLAGLTLKIHHSADEDPRGFGYRIKPLPQIMLEWIDGYHNPYPSQLQDIQSHRPSPSHHKLFWDTILNGVLRGKVVAVVELLRNAGWRYARTGLDDIHDRSGQTGFSGLALANIEKVMQAACDVLQQCPAVRGDWDIRGSDWQLFRLRISQASEDLKRFAEGRDSNDRNLRDNGESFGFSTAAARSGTFSKTAQKAESRVPWHIYQNLLSLYGLISGEAGPIIENAQDWCEATVGLVVWWDEGKNDRRLALGRSHANYRASSRESDPEAYLKKLRRSFETVMASSSDFQVNTMSPLEVGLASVFEGDNESVIGFLRAWSGPISTAVAEIASLGGWLPHAEPRNLISMDSLDQEDLDLLGINSSPSKSDGVKDHTLITYARALSQRGTLKVSGPSGATAFKEGWELAIAVLGRLDSGSRSEEVVGDFLKQLPLDSSATVDKLWRLLNDLGMTNHAEATAQTYADLLAEDSHNYGEALWYYALSHKATKVKDVLDLLISISLIQSTAYPPESDLDDHLRQLISSPQRALNEMSKMDFEAAKLLHKMISGYATLRRFYVLRDEEVSGNGEKPKMGSKARNREAVAALLAVVTSSADNIRGGLYDERRGAVVSVDFLLALLGEATVFVNQPKSSLSVSQIEILLKAIEDLQTVVSRVYDDCHEFFQTVLASAQGLKGSSPTGLLRKSTSNLSGSSQFSLVGSSMLASQLQRSIGSSGVLVKGNIKRGWDWRRGLSANTNGEDVLRILRLGLAKDLAKAWLLEADNRM